MKEYDIVGVLGSGGHGVVLLARYLLDGAPVAIKKIPKSDWTESPVLSVVSMNNNFVERHLGKDNYGYGWFKVSIKAT